MQGTEERDVILGLGGNDVLFCGSGSDNISGGERDDNLCDDGGMADNSNGGPDDDTCTGVDIMSDCED